MHEAEVGGLDTVQTFYVSINYDYEAKVGGLEQHYTAILYRSINYEDEVGGFNTVPTFHRSIMCMVKVGVVKRFMLYKYISWKDNCLVNSCPDIKMT